MATSVSVELVRLEFNTQIALNSFLRVLEKHGYSLYGSGIGVGCLGLVICLKGNVVQHKKVIYGNPDEKYKLIRYAEISQFDLMPDEASFTELLRTWEPSVGSFGTFVGKSQNL